MQLDKYIGVNKQWFENLTKDEQVEFVMSAKHIKTRVQAVDLLKGVSCKVVTKKKKRKDGV